MKRRITDWAERAAIYAITWPIMLPLAILIWIDWKRNYDGLPLDAWGMPHPHE